MELVLPKESPPDDIWNFYRYNDASMPVPCCSLKTFMLLLQSPRTYQVMHYPEAPLKKCLCVFYGPPAEDHRFYEHPMNGRLQARYVLTADEIHDRESGLTDEEKRLLVSLMREKGNTDTGLLCRTMNLPRAS